MVPALGVSHDEYPVLFCNYPLDSDGAHTQQLNLQVRNWYAATIGDAPTCLRHRDLWRCDAQRRYCIKWNENNTETNNEKISPTRRFIGRLYASVPHISMLDANRQQVV
jgi:hypothetical protein